MSWYNDEQENNFIDATQEHTGGGGGLTTELTIINEPTITDTPEGVPTISVPELNIGFETTINDLINIRQDGNANFQVYINNANDNGEIRFYTKNAMNINDYNYSYLTFSYSEPRLTYNTKINKDGILQYYHSYHIAYPLKLSGWYSVDYDISEIETAQNAQNVALGALGALVAENQTAFGTFLTTDYAPFKALSLQNFASIYEVLASIQGSRNIREFYNSERSRELIDSLISSMPSGVNIANIARQTSTANYLPVVSFTSAGLYSSRINTATAFSNSLQQSLTYAGIGAGLYLIYQLIDKGNEDRATEDQIRIATLKTEIDKQIASGNTAEYQTQSYIYKNGLNIVSATNGGFTTDGVYEIDIDNDAKLGILVQGGTASILSVENDKDGAYGYAINDIITIPKSNLGGSSSGTNDLEINVVSLYSLEEIYEFIDVEIYTELNEIKGRQRRREFIPDKNSFGDGINVVENNITEPSGEITKELDISLKVDTNQFQYDETGNLQITGFANIGNTGNLGIPSDNTENPPVLATGLNLAVETNTGNISTLQTNLGVASSIIPLISATGLNLDVETLREEVGDNNSIPKTGIHKSIDDILNLLGTIPDYDADGNVVDLATGIYARIDNIYKVVMEEGFTFDNNTNYKLSLGYDSSVWGGFYYNLFCVALKSIRAGVFSSSFYGNDFMGLFPSLERVSDKSTEYLIVKDIGIELLTNFHFKKGLLYFDNVNPVIDFNLARKVEYVIFLTPKNIDNLNVEYTILQTGVRLPSTEYDIDDNKLKLSIINNKLNLTNYIYYNQYYYQS